MEGRGHQIEETVGGKDVWDTVPAKHLNETATDRRAGPDVSRPSPYDPRSLRGRRRAWPGVEVSPMARRETAALAGLQQSFTTQPAGLHPRLGACAFCRADS